MLVDVMGFMNLLCAGLLAGVEFVIRYGVRAPLTTLDPQSEIQLRQTLIRRLRVVVPAIFGLAFLSGIGVTFREGRGTGFGFRCAGLLALVAFISITLGGDCAAKQSRTDLESYSAPRCAACNDQKMGTTRYPANLGGRCGVRHFLDGWCAGLNTAPDGNFKTQPGFAGV
jgi:hypothetical protein